MFNRTMPRLVLVYRVGKVMYNECGHKKNFEKKEALRETKRDHNEGNLEAGRGYP